MKIEDPMSTLKHERPVIDRTKVDHDSEVANGFGDRVYRLTTKPWFGFGLAIVSGAIALLCLFGSRKGTRPGDYSSAIVAGAATVAFGLVGVSARIVRRDPPQEGPGQR